MITILKLLIVISSLSGLDSDNYLIREETYNYLLIQSNKYNLTQEILLILNNNNNNNNNNNDNKQGPEVINSLKRIYLEYYNIPYIFSDLPYYYYQSKLQRLFFRDCFTPDDNWIKEYNIYQILHQEYADLNTKIIPNVWEDTYYMEEFKNELFHRILDSGHCSRSRLLQRIALVELNYTFNYNAFFEVSH